MSMDAEPVATAARDTLWPILYKTEGHPICIMKGLDLRLILEIILLIQ